MTIEQKQCLLKYLGYYQGKVDGIWGQQSAHATAGFQDDYGLQPTSIFDEKTQALIKKAVAGLIEPLAFSDKKDPLAFWAEIKHFKREEFRCKCGGRYCDGYPSEIDEKMVRIADEVRERIGKPIVVNSGVRCKTHNANVGGVSNSQHLYGTAADLGRPNGVTPKEMAAIAEEIMGTSGGLGIYDWGIHIDSRPNKSRWNG